MLAGVLLLIVGAVFLATPAVVTLVKVNNGEPAAGAPTPYPKAA